MKNIILIIIIFINAGSLIVNNDQGNGVAGINISSLSKGIYYVSLITDNGIQRARFIKQ
jgi:hypothetical protein